MRGQFFSIKVRISRIVITLFFVFLAVKDLSAAVLTIGSEQGRGGYVGKHLEILSEGVLFENLETVEVLPEEFRAVILSGRFSSNPDVAVDLDRSADGLYRAGFNHMNSGQRSEVFWSVEDVMKESVSSRFVYAERAVPVLDFRDHAWWIRLRLYNENETAVNMVLEFDKNTFSWFDMFSVNEDKTLFYSGAYETPMSERVMQESNILFPFVLSPGEQSLYFRMESQMMDTVPIRVWREEAFHRQNNREKFLHGLTSGAALLLLIYALFLAFSFRERSYIYLALLIFAGYLVHLSDSGLGMTLFWPESPMGSIMVFSASMPLTVIINLLFCRYFLKLQLQTPVIDKIILAFLFSAAILLVVQFFVPVDSRFVFSGLTVLLDYLSVVPLVLALILVFRREKKGGRLSLFLMAAVGFQVLSYIEYWMSRYNVIPLGLIDFLHLRSIGFALVMLGGVRFKMSLMEKTIRSLREELVHIIRSKSEAAGSKKITDETQVKVEAVKDLIEKHFREPLYRDDLAESVSMSRDHLGRMFKKLTGEKISDYINRLRIAEACRLLQKDSKKIIDIAFDVGFENLRTFNMCFSKRVEMAPREYRKQHRKSDDNC